MDRTVSRRSEPSSRAALMGEQPNPWNVLPLQDATSRHRGAKPPRRCGLLGEIACYPYGNFYPMSDAPSIQRHRITISYFRTCSTCRSHSQAPFCYYTQRLISDQPEGTFERLRYILGGDRPSQTAYQKLFPALLLEGSGLEFKLLQSGISTMTPQKLTLLLQSLPPILHNKNPNSISSYSKAQ